MKKLAAVLTLAFLLAACGSSKPRTIPHDKKLRVAVGDLINKSGDKELDSFSRNTSQIFVSELHNTGWFRVIERDRLADMLEEIKIGETGFADEKQMKQIGKVAGADALFLSNLTSVDYNEEVKKIGPFKKMVQTIRITIEGRMVNTETGEILAASKRERVYTHSFRQFTESVTTGAAKDKSEFIRRAIASCAKYITREVAIQIRRDIYDVHVGSKEMKELLEQEEDELESEE